MRFAGDLFASIHRANKRQEQTRIDTTVLSASLPVLTLSKTFCQHPVSPMDSVGLQIAQDSVVEISASLIRDLTQLRKAVNNVRIMKRDCWYKAQRVRGISDQLEHPLLVLSLLVV